MAATEPDSGRANDNTSDRQLSTHQLALARSRAYSLLSQLYLAGVTAQNLAQVQALPELAAGLTANLALPFDADEAAADHHHLFGFNVHPYQSFFLDPAGLLGGPVTDSVTLAYQNLGFQPGTSGESADHVGFELGLLAFLCAAEAEALEDGRPEIARQMGEHQVTFLQTHLLRWIGPLTLAVKQQGHPFYDALARVTFDLAREHVAGMSALSDRLPASERSLPAAPDVLADEGTGLKEIASFLLTPVYSGIYLGRDDIGRLARRQAIPRGFGDRRQLLLNLLRSGANYDALSQVIESLEEIVVRWLADYDEMMAREGPGGFSSGWRSRAAGTAVLLQQMHGRVEALD